MKLEFEISDEAYDLLQKIGIGYAEYRDTQFETVEEFKVLNDNGNRTIESFLTRNYGGTYYLIRELDKYGFVTSDYESWNLTYQLTDFGKQFLIKK